MAPPQGRVAPPPRARLGAGGRVVTWAPAPAGKTLYTALCCTQLCPGINTSPVGRAIFSCTAQAAAGLVLAVKFVGAPIHQKPSSLAATHPTFGEWHSSWHTLLHCFKTFLKSLKFSMDYEKTFQAITKYFEKIHKFSRKTFSAKLEVHRWSINVSVNPELLKNSVTQQWRNSVNMALLGINVESNLVKLLLTEGTLLVPTSGVVSSYTLSSQPQTTPVGMVLVWLCRV